VRASDEVVGVFHAIMQQKGIMQRNASHQGLFVAKSVKHTASTALYLKTLPSANSMVLPSTTTGLSQAHMLSTNSLSSALVGSSLVKV
jgi:hypothetical protein